MKPELEEMGRAWLSNWRLAKQFWKGISCLCSLQLKLLCIFYYIII